MAARSLVLAVLLLAPAVAAAAATGTATYRGEINADNNRRFFDDVDGRPVRRLVIDSPGGGVRAGIELGRWVFRNGIDVEVAHRCFSSCANYVFPAGRGKRLRRGAVVAWHGNYHHLQATGLWRDDIEPRMDRTGEDRATAAAAVRRQVEELVAMERGFFRSIGVDQHLCWIGKLPPHSVPDYFTMPVDDMARFGVGGVVAQGDYRRIELDRFPVDIRWLDL